MSPQSRHTLTRARQCHPRTTCFDLLLNSCATFTYLLTNVFQWNCVLPVDRVTSAWRGASGLRLLSFWRSSVNTSWIILTVCFDFAMFHIGWQWDKSYRKEQSCSEISLGSCMEVAFQWKPSVDAPCHRLLSNVKCETHCTMLIHCPFRVDDLDFCRMSAASNRGYYHVKISVRKSYIELGCDIRRVFPLLVRTQKTGSQWFITSVILFRSFASAQMTIITRKNIAFWRSQQLMSIAQTLFDYTL